MPHATHAAWAAQVAAWPNLCMQQQQPQLKRAHKLVICPSPISGQNKTDKKKNNTQFISLLHPFRYKTLIHTQVQVRYQLISGADYQLHIDASWIHTNSTKHFMFPLGQTFISY